MRSLLRNLYWKNPPLENECLYKNQRNKCVFLRKKIHKRILSKNYRKGIVSTFWNFVKPFLTNKSSSLQNDFVHTKSGKTIFDENALVETLMINM